MSDQAPSSPKGGEADNSLSPSKIAQTSNAQTIKPATAQTVQPATSQHVQHVEQQMSSLEKATLRWAKLAVGMSGVAAFFVCLQWYEMRRGGQDTHDLAVAAGRQADRMKDFADRMKDQADRTKDLADRMKDQADQTKILAEEAKVQATEATIAANAAQESAQTAKDTLIASQGAYVTIGRKDGVVAEFIASKENHPDENVPLVVYFQNTGHIPARVAWDTFDNRNDGKLASLGIHRFTTGTGRTPLPPGMLGKNGEFYESGAEVIAGESVGRNELAYISQSDLEKLSTKIVGFYIDGYYAYCDQLGTWSTHQFTLNYHSDIPIDLRFALISDIEIANTPIPKSSGGKSYFPPCTSTLVMSQAQQYASHKAK